MTVTRYDRIGINYTQNRMADIRILKSLDRLLNLPDGSTIADIGAGTGNYSNALANLGYNLKAVEPSQKMRSQATPNAKVEWLCGTAEKIPLPHDLTDLNMYSGWNRPEIYLDPQARQSMSGFALTSPSTIENGIASLGNHLKSGTWDHRYGHLRKEKYFDAGFRFIKLG